MIFCWGQEEGRCWWYPELTDFILDGGLQYGTWQLLYEREKVKTIFNISRILNITLKLGSNFGNHLEKLNYVSSEKELYLKKTVS
jgi:hypothetical protein